MNKEQAKELLLFYNKMYGSGDLLEGMAKEVVKQFKKHVTEISCTSNV